jgi:hypothetical protein
MATDLPRREAAETLALRALAHVAGDADLGPRFLDLTGLDVATLRARAGEDDILAAVLGFLDAHEPSLIATAHALDVPPAALVAAHRSLTGSP